MHYGYVEPHLLGGEIGVNEPVPELGAFGWRSQTSRRRPAVPTGIESRALHFVR
jgi:hypothetical protein